MTPYTDVMFTFTKPHTFTVLRTDLTGIIKKFEHLIFETPET